MHSVRRIEKIMIANNNNRIRIIRFISQLKLFLVRVFNVLYRAILVL